jgi:hypothetical protein
MERKDFITKGIVSGALLGASILTSASNATGNTNKQNDKSKMEEVQMVAVIPKK